MINFITLVILFMFDSMSNQAIAAEIGERIEQLRLEQNITQSDLADELGLTRTTYRHLVSGKAKFENVIAALRALGRLDLVENFIPRSEFSPLELAKLKGHQRQRASSASTTSADKTNNSDYLDW